jgi:hypothetical protein
MYDEAVGVRIDGGVSVCSGNRSSVSPSCHTVFPCRMVTPCASSHNTQTWSPSGYYAVRLTGNSGRHANKSLKTWRSPHVGVYRHIIGSGVQHSQPFGLHAHDRY